MAVTSVRLDDGFLKQMDALARKFQVDRTTIFRRAVEKGLEGMRLDEALQEYQKGRLTAWASAGKAGVSLWEFLELLKQRNIYFETSEADLKEMLAKL
jgi:predicted transcriptional regulator